MQNAISMSSQYAPLRFGQCDQASFFKRLGRYLTLSLLLFYCAGVSQPVHGQCSVKNLPYKADFDNASSFSDLQPCWSRQSVPPSSSFAWEVGSGSTGSSNTGPATDNSTGAQGSYLYTETSNISSSAPDSAWIQTPSIAIPNSGSPGLRFYYHMYGSSSDLGTLYVEVSYNNGQSWVPLYKRSGPDQPSASAAWKDVVLDLRLYKGDTVQFRFWHRKASGREADLAIDDVEVSNCLSPTALKTTFADSDSAGVAWQSALNQGNQWEVEWGKPGFTPGNGKTKTVSQTSATIKGLDSTAYDVYVLEECGRNTFSSTSGPISFCTEALPPYTEDFSSGFPTCWKGNSSGVSIAQCSGENALSIEGGETVTAVAVDASGLKSLKVGFDWGAGACGKPDPATDDQIRFQYKDGKKGWVTAKTFTGPNALTRDSIVVGNNNGLSDSFQFRVETDASSGEWQLDSVVFEKGNDCPQPRALKTLSVGSDSAKLTWTPALGTNYKLEWGKNNNFSNSTTVKDTVAKIGGLTSTL